MRLVWAFTSGAIFSTRSVGMWSLAHGVCPKATCSRGCTGFIINYADTCKYFLCCWVISSSARVQMITGNQVATRLRTSRAPLNRLLNEKDASLPLTILKGAAD